MASGEPPDWIDQGFEYFQPGRPTTNGMRDSATLWVMDNAGEVAFPRITFDAIEEDWEHPCVQLNFVDASGRTLRIWDKAQGSSRRNAAGQVTTREAGGLRFTCLEPFRRWRVEFDGEALASTTHDQLAGHRDGPAERLSFAFEASMAAPPWFMGGMSPEAARAMRAGDGAALMGGIRYEQLCTVHGTVRYDGQEHRVSGSGMRVRRQGVRNMGAALAHCQHSALFPSGRAFGAIIMAAGPDGPELFNEAFVIDAQGRRMAARVIKAPWMTRLIANGDDAGLELAGAFGTIAIDGAVTMSLFDHHNFEMAATSILQQGAARYCWDSEVAIGLIERCSLHSGMEGSNP